MSLLLKACKAFPGNHIKTHKTINPIHKNRIESKPSRGDQVKRVPSEFVDKAGERKKRKVREKEMRERGEEEEAIFGEKQKQKEMGGVLRI